MASTDDRRWQDLASLARVLGQSAPPETILKMGADQVLSALGADSVSISRLEPGTWTLRTLINAGALGPDEEPTPEAELYQLEEFAHFEHVFRDQRVWVASLDDPRADAADVDLLQALNKGSSLTAPLVVDGALWGELYASWYSSIGAAAALHDGYLEALTAILGGAISRAFHTEALEQLAFRDPLTGLANRRALDDAARSVFSGVTNGVQRRVTVVAADINNLKAINDAAGHHHGDQLIKAMAGQLVRQFAHLYGSLCARVGGDEFTVLVPGHALPVVTAAADALCADARTLPGAAGLACGVASMVIRDSRSAPRHLFSAADQAMYVAKRSGSPTAVAASEQLQHRAVPAAKA